MEGSHAPLNNSLTSLMLPSGSNWRSTGAVVLEEEGPDFSWLTNNTPTPSTEVLDLWMRGTVNSSTTVCQEMNWMDGMETGSPNPALRSLRKKSGLFDNELTDDLLEDLPSVTDTLNSLSDDHTTTTTLAGDSLDLLSSTQSDLSHLFGDLETTTDDLLSSLSGGKFDPETDLPSLPDSPFDLEGGMDFGEQFTDLSQLTNAILGEDAINLLKEEVAKDQSLIAVPVIPTSSSAVPLVTPTPSTSSESDSIAKVTKGKKRKIKTSTTTTNKEIEISTAIIAPNHDHDDYTAKRPKLSTSSLDESEYVSDCESVSSTIMVTTSSDKYKTRRMKNNVASRRSRATRKQKFQDMEDRVGYLENQNQVLQEKIEIMEGLAKSLKQHLVARMAAK